MTEREWLTGTHPRVMLAFLAGKVSDRKVRLFATACARSPTAWRMLIDPRSRAAVELAERFADGVATAEERVQAMEAAYAAWHAIEGADRVFLWPPSANEDTHNSDLCRAVRAIIRAYEASCAVESNTAYGMTRGSGDPFAPQGGLFHALDVAREVPVAIKPFPILKALVTVALRKSRTIGQLYLVYENDDVFSYEDFPSSEEYDLIHRATRRMEQAYVEVTTAWVAAKQGVTKVLRAMMSSARAAADCCADIGGATHSCLDQAKGRALLLRCIAGNPFQPAPLSEVWRTSDVLGLARGIYAERAFDRMPVLADALQDVGCDDETMLAHCRGPGPHARGCWVVDLLLGLK